MRTVTCTTEGCINQGIPIEIPDDSTAVVCGPCCQWIIPPAEQEFMEE